MAADPVMFMTGIRISECIKDLKLKNTEGYDRIPQRILLDGLEVLIEPLMIYRDQAIPGQWLISKIIPVHKKGEKVMIENYRPVANLCCVGRNSRNLRDVIYECPLRAS